MNIELQCCALFIIFTITVMFLREKKLDLMNRRLFFRAICACFACLIFDILSVVLINMSVFRGFSPFITSIVCKLYIMLLVLQGLFLRSVHICCLCTFSCIYSGYDHYNNSIQERDARQKIHGNASVAGYMASCCCHTVY